MTEIQHPGCKFLLGRRMFVAMTSSIVVQFIFMSCVILITNLSITHPLSWLSETWSMITCLRMWCYFIVLAAVIVLQGVVCSKNYLTAPPYLKSRFDALCSMFTPHNFLVGSLYVTIGIVLVWLHLSLEDGDYGSLIKQCKTRHGFCLVEEHFFLMLGGIWTGSYHFARANFNRLGYLEFLPIPRSKFVQVTRGIATVLPSAMMNAVWPSLYLLVLYFFLGTYLREIIISIFFLNLEDAPLDSLSRLLNPSLIFHAWLYAALFLLTMNTMHLLFQACLTEWTHFDINQKNYFNCEKSGITLAEALAMDKIPIMQHLGYLDLVTTAQKDKIRRSQIFSLSQPGGHPYNWNCILEKCLILLSIFTSDIEDVCSGKQEGSNTGVKATIEVQEKMHPYHMRNLVNTQMTTMKNEIETKKRTTESVTMGYLKNERDNFISYLLSKPLIFYFFGKQSDNKICHILNNGQTIVWAADAISSLGVVSLKEDSYGIVQKDLPDIIHCLVHLKWSLDKLQKTNMLVKKPQNDDKAIRMILTALRMATKRSIYRIVTSFRDYLSDIPLDLQVQNQLQSYLAYRE